MNSPTTNHETLSRNQKILEFWHKVEFFIPHDLQKNVLESKSAEWSVRTFTKADLLHIDLQKLWEVSPPDGELSGFDLYLGIFDKSDLATITSKVINEHLTEAEITEQLEKDDLEGATCFAQIKINHLGEALLNELSVSTAPWALGQIQADKTLNTLSFDDFQEGLFNLKAQLRNFQTQRINNRNSKTNTQLNPSEIAVFPITGTDILALIEMFYNWAGYRPTVVDGINVVIQAKTKPITHKPTKPSKDIVEEGENPDTKSDSIEEPEISILNSFYAKDIERVIEALQLGEINTSLENYLNPINDDQRLDLYTQEGRKFILNDLFPSSINSGHWLDNKTQTLSLMQQFAIGRVFDSLKNGGLFSVNGPPGTGKTTLLRDIFAENITRRARVLAGYTKSTDAFQKSKISVNFLNSKATWTLSQLKPELTGYEMLVASSNNSAVENISRDLPKLEAIGTEWKINTTKLDSVGYLKSVANKIASQKENGEFQNLSLEDTPWGLISVALGNNKNRKAFVDRLSNPKTDPNTEYPYGLKKPYAKGFSPDKHKSIWQWVKDYKGLSFVDAKVAFLKAEASVNLRRKALSKLANLNFELKGKSQLDFTQQEILSLSNAKKTLEEKESALQNIERDLQLAENQLENLRGLEELLSKQRPGVIASFLRRPSYIKYKEDIIDCHSKQGDQLRIKIELQPKHRSAKTDFSKATSNLKDAHALLVTREKEWVRKNTELKALEKEFPQATCPEIDDIELKDWQRFGVWRDDKLNALRSELFSAALQLHEAWLSEVLLNGGGFSPNIIALCNLLSGDRLVETKHALAIWQSLFMMVPVVSSTFASISNQFRYLESDSLGWLFIDEAGQATPQAAVGALWRSKRAVIVGDPLQIEPVFTVPIKLIKALYKTSNLSDDVQVMPHKVSVQTLADLSNKFGTKVAGENDMLQWIGSPLRVHRRCFNPMFKIANSIAYNNKMVYGMENENPPESALDLGRSAWVDVGGAVSDKQVVPAQVDLVFKALVALYQAQKELPPLYIISPFKQIKNELIKTLSDIKRWELNSASQLPSKTDLQYWCSTNIGTVHTFQGKENSIVWMVLGCDKQTTGATSWASSKPNLLNVALTRAKHRFFMIGDAAIWANQKYFNSAYSELDQISPDNFLQRMRTSK